MTEIQGKRQNTLQIFVTSACNKRCPGCFYATNMRDASYMPLDTYVSYIEQYRKQIPFTKITLLGGEPLLHPQVCDMLRYNQQKDLCTTVYTNGNYIQRLEGIDLTDVTVRVGVLGLHCPGEPKRDTKRLIDVPQVSFEFDICYMVRRWSRDEVLPAMAYAEEHFVRTAGSGGIGEFMISNIVDFENTRRVWNENHPTCLSRQEYIDFCEMLRREYKGGLNLQFSKRGAIGEPGAVKNCRFLNVLHDGRTCLCPFDIPLLETGQVAPETVADFGRRCNKGPGGCFFQKCKAQP